MTSQAVGRDLYVAPNGDDAWSGAARERVGESTDGPLASLEAARDAIRAMRRDGGLPEGGVTVWLAKGVYPRSTSFTLGREDSGTAAAPIVYRGPKRGRARFTGGRPVTGFAPVTDPAVLNRLPPRARKHVHQADLTAQGLSDFGAMGAMGFHVAGVPAGLELFFGDRPMALARWPNVDFVKVLDVPTTHADEDGWGGAVGKPEGGFIFRNDRLKRWKPSDDIWVHGYWCWDWANSYDRVESIDTETGLVRTRCRDGHYGYRKGQRFYFLNVLEELDRPGEWYLDRPSGRLYFWPPSDLRRSEAWVSVLAAPVMAMDGVEHVTIRDLTVECARGAGIEVKGGARTLIVGCEVKHVGNYAIEVRGGTDHAVRACDISHTGGGGVNLTGGDRASLLPCNHVVENCHIHHFGRLTRTYCPAILAAGVGMRFAHNLLHDAPHTAILFSGNEFLVEHNEIHTVCMETGDAGAIYTGRDYTFRGNVVRRNFIHHMGGVGMGTMGIYNDDCVSGTRMEDNVFYRLTRAAMLGGGRDLLVSNNLFVDCGPAIFFDARGISAHTVWHNMVYGTMKERNEAVGYSRPPYSERYPELLDIVPYYAEDKGVPPENCVAERNVCIGGHWLAGEPEQARRFLREAGNVIQEADPGFEDPSRLDFRIPASSPVYRHGFRPVSLAEIGLFLDASRTALPEREVAYVHFVREGTGGGGDDGSGGGVGRGGVEEVSVVIENPGQAKTRAKVRFVTDPETRARVVGKGEAVRSVEPGGRAVVTFRVRRSPRETRPVVVGVALGREDFLRDRLTLSE